MTHRQTSSFRAVVLTVGISLAAAQSAQAALMLAGTAGSVNFCAIDQNIPCAFGVQLADLDPAVGIMRFGSGPIIVGGLSLSGALSTNVIGPTLSILNTSSLTLINPTASPVTVTLAVSATGFAGPTTRFFMAGSGLWQTADGSAIQLSWYHDPANSQGALTPSGRPGIALSTFDASVKKDPLDAFATESHQKSILLASPFSMTLGVDLTLASGGRLIGLGQAIVGALQ